MKIIRFLDNEGNIRYGKLSRDDIQSAELIDGDIFGHFSLSGKTSPVKKLLSPVDPPNVIAVGLNYRDHAAETNMSIPDQPVIFLKSTTSVIGHNDPIILPAEHADEVDYEAELTIVIRKKMKNIPPENVRDYILGYTCGNDVSARDCQFKFDKQWARAKSFDTFCPIGPWIVTSDEVDPCDLGIKTILNGKILQNSRTSQMIFSPTYLVSFLSHQFTMPAGTIILTGTPPGVGYGRKPQVFLKPGDEVVVEIESIGQLKNHVMREKHSVG